MTPREPQATCFQFDKKLTFGFLLLVAVYVFGMGGWTGTISSRVTDNEEDIAKLDHVAEDIAEMKADIRWLVERERSE